MHPVQTRRLAAYQEQSVSCKQNKKSGTHHSPAIDRGDSSAPSLPATDQRGYSRIVGNGFVPATLAAERNLAVRPNRDTDLESALVPQTPLSVRLTYRVLHDFLSPGEKRIEELRFGSSHREYSHV